jgi:hypothetical protein
MTPLDDPITRQPPDETPTNIDTHQSESPPIPTAAPDS